MLPGRNASSRCGYRCMALIPGGLLWSFENLSDRSQGNISWQLLASSERYYGYSSQKRAHQVRHMSTLKGLLGGIGENRSGKLLVGPVMCGPSMNRQSCEPDMAVHPSHFDTMGSGCSCWLICPLAYLVVIAKRRPHLMPRPGRRPDDSARVCVRGQSGSVCFQVGIKLSILA